MKKEIEIKFTLEPEKHMTFEKWLEENAQFKGVEQHEEVYLNNPERSFFFDCEEGFKDAHVTMRLRSKIMGDKRKDLFCSKICHVDAQNRTVSRDEYEIDLSQEGMHENLKLWLEGKGYENFQEKFNNVQQLTKVSLTNFFKMLGFTDVYELKKERKIYLSGDFEIALDTLSGIGSFIEIELKSDEQDVVTGTQLIHEFLKKVGITQFVQYDRSYLHMVVNPEYNFGLKMNIATDFSAHKE